MKLSIIESTSKKETPRDETQLGFGRIFTDHMFEMEWGEQNGWHSAQIKPFAEIKISPAATCLHYGQETFEGLKAYRTPGGSVQLFRPEENFKRLNGSCRRLCIPTFDEDFVLDALSKLIQLDCGWIPRAEGASLYIRPFIIGTETCLGAQPSTKYRFLIILSPSGYYYPEGLAPVKIYVESHYIRAAAAGGTGEAKTGGNYAASLVAQKEAQQQGYSQVLWLDSVHRKYVEEVGAMNVFFVINSVVITPSLDGSILAGITRKSAIELLQTEGYAVEERKLAIDEIVKAYHEGTLDEAFGTGTAAIVSPIGEIKYQDTVMQLSGGEIGKISQMVFDKLTGIQFGKQEDPFGWIYTVE